MNDSPTNPESVEAVHGFLSAEIQRARKSLSNAQLLARLCRHTHSYVGRSRFGIESEAITEVSFDGACTTDATIDLLRGIPNLRDLLRRLRRISLESTLVTERSLKFLERELPHVEIAYSHYLED
jgi:hypothetical protein